jgi:hypothetical protein
MEKKMSNLKIDFKKIVETLNQPKTADATKQKP